MCMQTTVVYRKPLERMCSGHLSEGMLQSKINHLVFLQTLRTGPLNYVLFKTKTKQQLVLLVEAY